MGNFGWLLLYYFLPIPDRDLTQDPLLAAGVSIGLVHELDHVFDPPTVPRELLHPAKIWALLTWGGRVSLCAFICLFTLLGLSTRCQIVRVVPVSHVCSLARSTWRLVVLRSLRAPASRYRSCHGIV